MKNATDTKPQTKPKAKDTAGKKPKAKSNPKPNPGSNPAITLEDLSLTLSAHRDELNKIKNYHAGRNEAILDKMDMIDINLSTLVERSKLVIDEVNHLKTRCSNLWSSLMTSDSYVEHLSDSHALTRLTALVALAIGVGNFIVLCIKFR